MLTLKCSLYCKRMGSAGRVVKKRKSTELVDFHVDN